MSEMPLQFRPKDLKGALDLPDSVPNLYRVVEKEGASGEYEMKIDFMEFGVAYNETSVSSIRLTESILLRQVPLPTECTYEPLPRLVEGVNHIGFYKVSFDDDAYSSQIFIPAERSYDPAGVRNDAHCSISIGCHCSTTQTALFAAMTKALAGGATYESVRDAHFDIFNPMIEKYHGRIPLAMWMLFQLKCVFQSPRSKPPTYAQFLIQSLKAENQRVKAAKMRKRINSGVEVVVDSDEEQEVTPEQNTGPKLLTEAEEVLRLFSMEEEACGKFLGQYVKWDEQTSELVVRDQRMGHLKEYLQSFLTGFAFPPIEYFDNIYGHLRKHITAGKARKVREMEKERESGSGSEFDATTEDDAISAISSFFSVFMTSSAPKRQIDPLRGKSKSSTSLKKKRVSAPKGDSSEESIEVADQTNPLARFVPAPYLLSLAEACASHMIGICRQKGAESNSNLPLHVNKIMDNWIGEANVYRLITRNATSEQNEDERLIPRGWRQIDLPIQVVLKNRHPFASQGSYSRTFGTQVVTSLLFATVKRNKAVCRELLQNQYRDKNGYRVYVPAPNVRDANGWTALMHACAWGDTEVVDWLLGYAQGWSRDDVGVLTDPVQARAVFHADVDVNAQSHDGITAMMIACKEQNLDVVERLLKVKDHVSSVKANLFMRSSRVINLGLRTEGRKYLAREGLRKGCTVLHLVCGMSNENTDLVKLLLQGGAPVGARDSDGNTALHYAAKMGHVSIVKRLLLNDAAATAVNETGLSPLMMACKHAFSLSTAVALVAVGGANINRRDYYGKSALHYAFEAYKESHTMKQYIGSARLISKVWKRWKRIQQIADKRHGSATKLGETPLTNDSSIHSCLLGGQILMYTLPGCIFCNKVKELFSGKNVKFHNVDLEQYPHRHASMAGTTVPEVWFNEKLIGGWTECKRLNDDGKLDQMVVECLTTPAGQYAPLPVDPLAKKIRENIAQWDQHFSGFLSKSLSATAEAVRRRRTVQNDVIHYLLANNADLEATSNSGVEPFDDNSKKEWLEKVRPKLIESAERPQGWKDHIWGYARTQKAVELKWNEVAKWLRVRQFIMWLVLYVLFFLSTTVRLGLNDQTSHLLHHAVVARYLGKPYDFSEQPNKRFLDTDTRQDFYNFMRIAVIEGIYDSGSFYERQVQAGSPLQPYNTGDYLPVVRHTKMVGRLRLRQLRVACEACPSGMNEVVRGTYPEALYERKNGNKSEAKACCYPQYSTSTESKETFVGLTGDTYTWKGSDVPSVLGSQETVLYPGSGHSVLFPNNLTESLRMLQRLETDQWIDLSTRAIFVEFVLSNIQEGLIASQTFLVEFFSAGAIIPSYEVQVWRQKNTTFSLVCDILFLVTFCFAFVDLIKSEYLQSWSATSRKTYVLKDVGERHSFFFYKPTAPNAKRYNFYWAPKGTYGAGFYRINHGDESKWRLGKDQVPHCILCCSNRRFPRSIYLICTNLRKAVKSLSICLLIVVVIVRLHIEITLRDLKNLSHAEVLPAGLYRLNKAMEFYASMCSVTLFVASLRLLDLLDWIPAVARMTIIISRQLSKLFSYFIILLVYMVAFSVLSIVGFGVEMDDYSTPFKSLMTMLGGVTINGLPWSDAHQSNGVLGPFFHAIVIFYGVIMLLNLIIAVMTEGYESVKELADETWAYTQFLQIKTFEEKAARRLAVLKNSNVKGEEQSDRIDLNKIDASNFKNELHLLRLARERGQVYPVSSRIGILCLQWYFDAKKRNWQQQMAGKRIQQHSGDTIRGSSKANQASLRSLASEKTNEVQNPMF